MKELIRNNMKSIFANSKYSSLLNLTVFTGILALVMDQMLITGYKLSKPEAIAAEMLCLAMAQFVLTLLRRKMFPKLEVVSPSFLSTMWIREGLACILIITFASILADIACRIMQLSATGFAHFVVFAIGMVLFAKASDGITLFKRTPKTV